MHVCCRLQAHDPSTWSPFIISDPSNQRVSLVLLIQVVTYTSDVRGAGTDATVFIELEGQLGSSPRQGLIPPGSASDSFGRGQADPFRLHLPELGKLQSLTIGRQSLYTAELCSPLVFAGVTHYHQALRLHCKAVFPPGACCSMCCV